MKQKIKTLTPQKNNSKEEQSKNEAPSEINDPTKEVAGLNKKIDAIKLDIAKLSFDLPVSYYYIDDKFSHIVWIGLTGSISSAVGVYQTW
jgi:hypothetical protein